MQYNLSPNLVFIILGFNPLTLGQVHCKSEHFSHSATEEGTDMLWDCHVDLSLSFWTEEQVNVLWHHWLSNQPFVTFRCIEIGMCMMTSFELIILCSQTCSTRTSLSGSSRQLFARKKLCIGRKRLEFWVATAPLILAPVEGLGMVFRPPSNMFHTYIWQHTGLL